MYDPNHLRDVLAGVLGTAAAWTMNDCPIGVMISATAMNGHNWFFVKDNLKNRPNYGCREANRRGRRFGLRAHVLRPLAD